jgi:hypothetical protein
MRLMQWRKRRERFKPVHYIRREGRRGCKFDAAMNDAMPDPSKPLAVKIGADGLKNSRKRTGVINAPDRNFATRQFERGFRAADPLNLPAQALILARIKRKFQRRGARVERQDRRVSHLFGPSEAA